MVCQDGMEKVMKTYGCDSEKSGMWNGGVGEVWCIEVVWTRDRNGGMNS